MLHVVTDHRGSILVSAALRHVDDAEHLLARSPDQSWHLAGFGPECARKACLEEGWLDRSLGHDLNGISDDVLEFALSFDVRAARYSLADLARRYPKLSAWHVESRYDATGTRTEMEARLLVHDASEFTYALAAELWMDGRVSIGA
jgi:hypothetical protein